ncbi:MAG: hypothetical protein KGZ80_07595 [Methylomonas sp.]|nr:hypothetical protein [Methylomonas sp.]PPD22810.1 MAG: hypothetical protein CTY23_00335 [Methylomonas sp.]PPD25917.1 MAG: hypothetical protein CTY22_06880 [Methylomonas sp.]PPD37651.1 MAG: hypothetical protein CTY21_06880 [Methylomonas sp.]PPD42752.1 MAG: hypothetical protein CTY17_00130 [Methylomonas sp.]
MHFIEPSAVATADMSQLHAATCLLMTRFLNGHHCPKLAHIIVQQLQKLLEHPHTQQTPDSREMYLQLLEHWQSVSTTLANRRHHPDKPRAYH